MKDFAYMVLGDLLDLAHHLNVISDEKYYMTIEKYFVFDNSYFSDPE